ncbi:hypothetical protein M0R19_05485 [Candidatus Pacearchaeota archaeon]|jgi:hypothetical protein|nr:hypothetical protein [Candidatus Pacearchaeota archaeon]
MSEHSFDAFERMENGEGDGYGYTGNGRSYRTLEDMIIVRETDKAILVKDKDDEQAWIPKSQIVSIVAGVAWKDGIVRILITYWIWERLIWTTESGKALVLLKPEIGMRVKVIELHHGAEVDSIGEIDLIENDETFRVRFRNESWWLSKKFVRPSKRSITTDGRE